jgi:hypothetical protein
MEVGIEIWTWCYPVERYSEVKKKVWREYWLICMKCSINVISVEVTCMLYFPTLYSYYLTVEFSTGVWVWCNLMERDVWNFSLAVGLLAVTNELLELGIEAWYGDISLTYLYMVCETL